VNKDHHDQPYEKDNHDFGTGMVCNCGTAKLQTCIRLQREMLRPICSLVKKHASFSERLSRPPIGNAQNIQNADIEETSALTETNGGPQQLKH